MSVSSHIFTVLLLAVFTVGLLLASGAHAITYYVSSANGNDTDSGTSPSTPLRSFSKAYRSCVAFDTCEIILDSGEYTPTAAIRVSDSITLKTLRVVGNGTQSTTLIGARFASQSTSANLVVESLTVQGLQSFDVSAGDAALSNVTFVGQFQLPITLSGGSLSLASCQLSRVCGSRLNLNPCISSSNYGHLVITSTTISSNEVGTSVISATTSLVEISDSSFTDNQALEGTIALKGGSSLFSDRNTFSGNTALNQPSNIQCTGGSKMNFTDNSFVSGSFISCTSSSACISYGSIASSLPSACQNNVPSPQPSPSISSPPPTPSSSSSPPFSPSPSMSASPSPDPSDFPVVTVIIIVASCVAGVAIIGIIIGIVVYLNGRNRAGMYNQQLMS